MLDKLKILQLIRQDCELDSFNFSEIVDSLKDLKYNHFQGFIA